MGCFLGLNAIIMGHKIQVEDVTGDGNILNTGNEVNITLQLM
jgi:hypothetical protein